jgi:ABC-type transport system substrate-binding protein
MSTGLLVAASLLLAAVLSAVPADTLVVGTLADPAGLEPHQATDIVAAEVVASVCETLVRVRPGSLRPEGVLATTWASSDQRVWTFMLRQNVRFQDGAPLDADAVVGNLEHLRRERAFPGRARRVGPHLVQVTLDRASAALLSTLSQPFFAMQSPRRLAEPGQGRSEPTARLTQLAGPRPVGLRRTLGRRPPPAAARLPPLRRRRGARPGPAVR